MSTDRLGITILEANTCWELLRSSEVGRLAISIGNHPDIFPVNFVVDHGTVVFRPPRAPSSPRPCWASLWRSKSTATTPRPVRRGASWSRAAPGEIERMQNVFDALDLPLFPWHAAPKHRFVRIEPDDLSGRRFRVVDRTIWGGDPETPRASSE